MSVADEVGIIIEQETRLVLPDFGETIAFAIGVSIRERAMAEQLGIVVDVRTWDRPLFYAATPGSAGSNQHWARRKINVVRMYLKSTYRMALEQQRPDQTFKAADGLDPAEYVLAGGGFPIRVKGAGVIAAVAVSGLPSRKDHGLVVDALCDHLGLARQSLALPDVPA
jgi:uncharacterized protein (UPF0303 family)